MHWNESSSGIGHYQVFVKNIICHYIICHSDKKGKVL